MIGAVGKQGHNSEYWYTLIALLFITGALTPLLGILGGAQVEVRGDSNPFSFGLAALLYLVAGLLALESVGKTLELLRKNPLSIALLLLPLASIIWSVDPALTFRRAVACALTTVFCIYLAERLSPEELLKRLMFTLLLGGVASIFFSVLVPQYGMHLDAANYGAFRGVYGHKNELGRVSVIAIIVSYFVRPSNHTERLYRFLALTIFLFLLAMSKSVTNWFIMLGLVGFVPILALLRSERLSLFLRVFLVLSFGIAAIILVTSNVEELLAAVGRDETFTGRETLWRGVITVVSERYPILGAGYGAFFSNLGGVRELFFLVSSWGSIPEHAHNGYLNVWADLGAVGLLVLVLFLVTTTVHLLRRAINEPHRPAWGALSALMFFFLVNNISSSVALQHSDIAWIAIVLASFYARSAMPSDVRLRPIVLEHGRKSVYPMAPAVQTASYARPRSPTT
jgi:O-antigen ligase